MDFPESKPLVEEPEENFSDIPIIVPCLPNQGGVSPPQTPKNLFDEIRKNIYSCDLILCFFISALQSYKTDHCLRPFPPFYIHKHEKDFNLLRNTCDSIPRLELIIKEPNLCSKEVTKLLAWLFLDRGYPVLKITNKDEIPLICKVDDFIKPHFLFEVCYQSNIEENWKKRKGDKKIIMAFHGSATHNFYSILKVGLQQHFSLVKEVLFGNGIYLSTVLSISAHYAPFGKNWKNSMLGNKLSVIAICEIIDDAEKVKCKDSRNKARAINAGSLDEIPEKYFIVTGSDMVRVKYLMVYREKSIFSVKSFVVKNLFFIVLLMYFLFIVSIGIFNNTTFLKFIKKFIKDY